MKYLSKFLGFKGENYVLKLENIIKQNFIDTILTSTDAMIHQRNYDKMLRVMQQQIPKLFNFEVCNIMLYDKFCKIILLIL